jgi:Ca-activated chloride channel family protein
VTGRIANRPFARKLRVTLPDVEPKNAAISRLWARATIADLERQPNGQVDGEAVTRVALAHDLVTRFTSFVAIDSATPTGSSSPMLVKQPSEAPLGVDLAHAGGVAVPAAGAPSPEYGVEESAAPAGVPARESTMVSAAPRRGGCASCTTAPARGGPHAFGALALVAAALLARRRR